MAYNESTVIAGGLAHIPVIIFVLRFIENKRKAQQAKFIKS